MFSLAVPATALAYDEAVDGDLSSNPAAPTPIAFALGTNTVRGQVTNSGFADPRDYITFVIPAGRQLSALRLISYVDVPGGGPGNIGYHAINIGATSLEPSLANENSFLGGDHMFQLPSGTDLLPELANGDTAGTGFTVPLGPRTYSYVIQQTGPQTSGYHLEFVVSAAPPVPATSRWGLGSLLAALMVAGGLLAVRRRKAV